MKPVRKESIKARGALWVAVLTISVCLSPLGQAVAQKGGTSSPSLSTSRVAEKVILVKGAWSSATGSATPEPESGTIINNVFRDRYFGIIYPLPPGWVEKYAGPPPSDTGRYVLAELSRPRTYQGDAPGNILITARDMFFTSLPAANALQLINYTKSHLQADYELERQLSENELGVHFTGLAYTSPAAELHWYVLATEIRCHTVEFVFMNRDRKALMNAVLQTRKMQLPRDASPTAGMGGGEVPVCIRDYASAENVIRRVDPVFDEQRFNPVPVRIIIDRRGNVQHVHFLSAFPDQARAISDALQHWKFRPCIRNGHLVEVETGIMFGRVANGTAPNRRTELPPHFAAGGS